MYRIYGEALHTNTDGTITLSYIYRPEPEDFPPFFDSLLIARLASEFCIPITENTSRSTALYKQFEDEFKMAKNIDSMQDTPSRIKSFSLVDVRK